jgi:hypothetical protein
MINFLQFILILDKINISNVHFFKGLSMHDIERRTIIEFLRSADPEEYGDISGLSLSDLVDLMIDHVTEVELDYSILSTAFVNGVNPGKFENFHEAVMGQYENIADGDEIPVPVLDRLATQYR